MPEITVIVPVYKVEKYLDRCVKSILAQTWTDFELILVDDGSPDRCGSMCDDWAAKDSRIRVIHQKNGGLSAARNAGMDRMYRQSGSQWLTFVDSDDWLHPKMLEWMLWAAREENCEICVCGYGITGGEDPWTGEEGPVKQIWTASDFYRQKYINATIAWGKLYRRSLFEKVRYPVGKLHEDEFVTYRLLFGQEKFVYLDQPLYGYYVNPQGITKSAWNPRRMDAWEAYEEQIRFFEERGQADMVKFRFRDYLENAVSCLEAAEASEEHRDRVPEIERRIRRLIRWGWRRGGIVFWVDYDILYRVYPLTTKLYRFWLDRLGGHKHG